MAVRVLAIRTTRVNKPRVTNRRVGFGDAAKIVFPVDLNDRTVWGLLLY
jgi:hypothetical protein